jgi:hypothetical protein
MLSNKNYEDKLNKLIKEIDTSIKDLKKYITSRPYTTPEKVLKSRKYGNLNSNKIKYLNRLEEVTEVDNIIQEGYKKVYNNAIEKILKYEKKLKNPILKTKEKNEIKEKIDQLLNTLSSKGEIATSSERSRKSTKASLKALLTIKELQNKIVNAKNLNENDFEQVLLPIRGNNNKLSNNIAHVDFKIGDKAVNIGKHYLKLNTFNKYLKSQNSMAQELNSGLRKTSEIKIVKYPNSIIAYNPFTRQPIKKSDIKFVKFIAGTPRPPKARKKLKLTTVSLKNLLKPQ